MSVFRVKLQNVGQGQLDINPVTGLPFTTSNQRQIYVTGPKRIHRLLKDGDTFTDCNYWKKFSYPTATLENAFIEIVSDDGSVYSDVEEENTFVYGASFTLATSYNSSNTVDFLSLYGSPAKFMQVTNNDGSIAMTLELNGNTSATITLAAGESQVFNSGDLAITGFRLKSASGTPSATVIASIKAAVLS